MYNAPTQYKDIFLRSKKAIYSPLSSVSAGLLKTMRTCFVILLLICISLMYTVQAQSNSSTAATSLPAGSTPSKPSGSEKCVATLITLVMTLVTVFILQAKDWFC